MSERKRGDLGNAVDDVSRVATGMLGRLLGPKAVGKTDLDPAEPLNPKLDRALTSVGDAVGRVLQAVGNGLEHHPLDPEQAVHEIGARLRSKTPPEKSDGWSALSTGIGSLVGGVGAVADQVIDRVSAEINPKKQPAGVEPTEAAADAVVVPASEADTVLLSTEPAAPPKRDL